jgi:hypothetical protein
LTILPRIARVDAFDAARLVGTRPPLRAGCAYVNPDQSEHSRQQTGLGLRSDRGDPGDFNARPGADPTQSNIRTLTGGRIRGSGPF